MTDTKVCEINASYATIGSHPGCPYSVVFSIETETREQADAIAAQFTKSAKMIAAEVTDPFGPRRHYAVVHSYADLAANSVNRGVNETGVKRYHSVCRQLAKLGYTIEWTTPYINSYATQADFEAAIAQAV
jgi:hypothetical protein